MGTRDMLTVDDFKHGATLGKYEIIRKLAVGGMAEIYLARTRGTAGFEKTVVLKRILPSVAEDQGFVQMFLDEARLAATLRHPNIADVFDVGTEDGSYYFAMEFINGQDARSIRLAAHEADRDIPIEIALAIITSTTYALAYAHAKTSPQGTPLGVVHRDVSPSNILVSYDGAVKLVDFGIARADSRSTSVQTRTGTLKGKVPYMSPEQCRGKALDRRSDLFSLGTILYELTTGRRPFDGHSEYDTLEMIALGEAEPPSKQNLGYPKNLEAIVMKLLAREPAARYQTADVVLVDLERLTSGAGLMVSERVVAKYMRELFAEDIAEAEAASMSTLPVRQIATGSDVSISRPDDLASTPYKQPAVTPTHMSLELDEATPPPDDTREYPGAGLSSPVLDETGQPMQPLLLMPEVQVFVRSTRNSIPPPMEQPRRDFTDELPTLQSSRGDAIRGLQDTTRADAVLHFDPILARADDILDDIDRGAPKDEAIAARSLRRVTELLVRVGRWIDLGDFDQAAVGSELALEEDGGDEHVTLALVKGQPAMARAFESCLGDLGRPISLGRPLKELLDLELDQRSAYLLSRVDVNGSLGALIDGSAMLRFEACRTLCRLVLRKMIILG